MAKSLSPTIGSRVPRQLSCESRSLEAIRNRVQVRIRRFETPPSSTGDREGEGHEGGDQEGGNQEGGDEDGLAKQDQLLSHLSAKRQQQRVEVQPDNRAKRAQTFIINFAILASAIQMGFETQSTDSDWDEAWQRWEHFFVAVFTFEMLFRLWTMRSYYFLSPKSGMWNTLDFGIAWMGILDAWILPHVTTKNYSLGFVRVLRLLRLLRILRLLKDIPELVVIMEGIVASFRSMFWVLILLFVMLYSVAIMCVQVVGRNLDGYPARSEDAEMMKEEIIGDFNSFVYFGSLWRAMITLFNLVLVDEWAYVLRPIIEVQPVVAIPLFLLLFMATFGIFNVIIGVIVERTTLAMQRQRDDQIEAERRACFQTLSDLTDIACQIDKNANGEITLDEMAQAPALADFTSILEDVDFPHGFTFIDFFRMLDINGDNSVRQDEFVLGIVRLIFGDAFQQRCSQQLQQSAIRRDLRLVHEQLGEVRGAIGEDIAELRREVSSLRSEVGLQAVGFGASCDKGPSEASSMTPDMKQMQRENSFVQVVLAKRMDECLEQLVADGRKRTLQRHSPSDSTHGHAPSTRGKSEANEASDHAIGHVVSEDPSTWAILPPPSSHHPLSDTSISTRVGYSPNRVAWSLPLQDALIDPQLSAL